MSRGGHSQRWTTAVGDVAVQPVVTKLSSSAVRKDQAERAARERRLAITDGKGKLVNHTRSTHLPTLVAKQIKWVFKNKTPGSMMDTAPAQRPKMR